MGGGKGVGEKGKEEGINSRHVFHIPLTIQTSLPAPAIPPTTTIPFSQDSETELAS